MFFIDEIYGSNKTAHEKNNIYISNKATHKKYNKYYSGFGYYARWGYYVWRCVLDGLQVNCREIEILVGRITW